MISLSSYAKIGLLTADEIAFAGGAINTNSTNYLNNNTDKWSWWALSPFGFFDSDKAGVSFVSRRRSFTNFYVFFNLGVRPSLSLKSTVQISSGNGTRSNPYKVS